MAPILPQNCCLGQWAWKAFCFEKMVYRTVKYTQFAASRLKHAQTRRALRVWPQHLINIDCIKPIYRYDLSAAFTEFSCEHQKHDTTLLKCFSTAAIVMNYASIVLKHTMHRRFFKQLLCDAGLFPHSPAGRSLSRGQFRSRLPTQTVKSHTLRLMVQWAHPSKHGERGGKEVLGSLPQRSDTSEALRL